PGARPAALRRAPEGGRGAAHAAPPRRGHRVPPPRRPPARGGPASSLFPRRRLRGIRADENAKAVLNRIIELNPKRSLNASRQFRALCMREGSWQSAWEMQQRIEEQLAEMGRSAKPEKK